MPDEENDIRIREAVENYQPAYDDAAWNKMEKLLDKHLPHKRKRRKISYLFQLILLLGGIVFYVTLNNPEKKSSEAPGILVSNKQPGKITAANSSREDSPGKLTDNKLSNDKPDETNRNSLASTRTEPDKINKNKTGKERDLLSLHNRNKENPKVQTNVLLQKKKSTPNGNNVEPIIKSEAVFPKTSEAAFPKTNEFQLLNESNNLNAKNRTEPQIHNETKGLIEPQKTEEDTSGKPFNTDLEIIKNKTNSKSSFRNNIGIAVSAGPGISGVSRPGKIALVYGAGLSYSISKRFTISTGLYMSKLIYSVGSQEYHFPNGNSSYYNELQSVEANCNVQEIPLKLSYNFGGVNNQHYFISAGLSSYLMKKESYQFYYKTPAGIEYSNAYTVKNNNKNIFSVLNLSGGYQYTLNNRFSIIAEPYIHLPLNGIGAGKIKLNSGGILFTIRMKPSFKNRK